MKELYDTTKKLAEKRSKLQQPAKKKESKPITEVQEKRNKWVEYLEKPIEQTNPTEPARHQAIYIDVPTDVTLPTIMETSKAIKRTKSAKAAGPNSILAKALKSDIELTEKTLYTLFRKI